MNFKDALLKIKKEGLLDCIVDESNDYEVCSSIEKERLNRYIGDLLI